MSREDSMVVALLDTDDNEVWEYRWVVGRKRISIESILRSTPRLLVKANVLDVRPSLTATMD